MEEGSLHRATFVPSAYVHVEMKFAPLDVTSFSAEHPELRSLPDLVYVPQTEGDWFHFAYYFKDKRDRRGMRKGKPRLLDLFSGCGGMSQGFANCQYAMAGAVESNPDAAKAYKKNLGIEPFVGDVKNFLNKCKLVTSSV